MRENKKVLGFLGTAALALLLVVPLQAAEPLEPADLAAIEPVRWVLKPGEVVSRGPAQQRALLQLASIARHNEVVISITTARPEEALALARGLEARGVPAESIGIALRGGPAAEVRGTEVVLDVVRIGGGAPLQWAGADQR